MSCSRYSSITSAAVEGCWWYQALENLHLTKRFSFKGQLNHFSSELIELGKWPHPTTRGLESAVLPEQKTIRVFGNSNDVTHKWKDHLYIYWYQENMWGLPWWRSGWESACQCRGHRFEPWSGKIPHAAEQLGPWATTTEPARLEPVLRNKRGHGSERPAHRDEEWPPACHS